MPKALVLIPRADSVLSGAEHIRPGYPKSYTATDMRSWAADLDRLYQTPADDLARWRSTPTNQLTRQQRGVVDAYDHYFLDPSDGIKGDLRDDGRVELWGGRHRAAYLAEHGIDPVPVWVSHSDAKRLSEFQTRCHDDVDRRRGRELRRELGGAGGPAREAAARERASSTPRGATTRPPERSR